MSEALLFYRSEIFDKSEKYTLETPEMQPAAVFFRHFEVVRNRPILLTLR